FDQTGLPWGRPSPSMPNLESASHYPGTVIFEATNLSVGRGTPIAFQVIGAPWWDPAGIVAEVGDRPGVAMTDTTIVPVAPPDGKFADTAIPAVKFRVTDRQAYDPVALAVTLLAVIQRRHPNQLEVSADRLARLLGTADVWAELQTGASAAQIVSEWEKELAGFRVDRRPSLLYE
ncbi:MAG: hypothetical protein AMS20_16840, partial [Gemmatimonas sp. SG8_28]